MEHPVSVFTYFGDENFLSLNGMQLTEGRGFNKDLASDSLGLILNDAAVKVFNLGPKPIGEKINEYHVIGVVNDFHWESLRNKIAPLVIMRSKDRAELGIKLAANSAPSVLMEAERRWKQLVPEEPFQFHFLDDNFGELLNKEKVFGKAINFFTLLAIFISCLGLYGLSAFTAEQRTKEIGIRKVMGASALQIVTLLNKKFTLLVVIALLISVPLSVYILQHWLADFAYRVDLSAGVFLLTTVIALLVAWMSVSYHSLKATWINPAETLKYE
jgi:putative ABC transport system permease protein